MTTSSFSSAAIPAIKRAMSVDALDVKPLVANLNMTPQSDILQVAVHYRGKPGSAIPANKINDGFQKIFGGEVDINKLSDQLGNFIIPFSVAQKKEAPILAVDTNFSANSGFSSGSLDESGYSSGNSTVASKGNRDVKKKLSGKGKLDLSFDPNIGQVDKDDSKEAPSQSGRSKVSLEPGNVSKSKGKRGKTVIPMTGRASIKHYFSKKVASPKVIDLEEDYDDEPAVKRPRKIKMFLDEDEMVQGSGPSTSTGKAPLRLSEATIRAVNKCDSSDNDD